VEDGLLDHFGWGDALAGRYGAGEFESGTGSLLMGRQALGTQMPVGDLTINDFRIADC
jgi:hypothetical protein